MWILLDIDGVMVPAASWKAPKLLDDGFPDFSHKAIISLEKIISGTGASIVLTTSHKSKYSVAKWRKIFAKRGINAPIVKLRNSIHVSRREEILKWIKANKSRHYVIIDDDKSLNDLPVKIKQNLILTSPLIGLNESLAEKAIEALHNNSALVSV